MTGAAQAVVKLAAALARASTALGAAAVLLCFALVCYSVAMRYFLGDPLGWSDEVTGWLVVGVVMLGAADAQARGEHVGVDLVTERAGPRLKRALGRFGAATVAASAAIMAWQGWEMVRFSAMLDLKSNTLGSVPLWPVQALVPLGGLLLLAVALAQVAALAAGAEPGRTNPEAAPQSHE
ncbi:MAG: TRAP transporter small permease [Rhodospirillales bacterium]